eukprot:6686117-Prymnesium_polylepis.1
MCPASHPYCWPDNRYCYVYGTSNGNPNVCGGICDLHYQAPAPPSPIEPPAPPSPPPLPPRTPVACFWAHDAVASNSQGSTGPGFGLGLGLLAPHEDPAVGAIGEPGVDGCRNAQASTAWNTALSPAPAVLALSFQHALLPTRLRISENNRAGFVTSVELYHH